MREERIELSQLKTDILVLQGDLEREINSIQSIKKTSLFRSFLRRLDIIDKEELSKEVDNILEGICTFLRILDIIIKATEESRQEESNHRPRENQLNNID